MHTLIDHLMICIISGNIIVTLFPNFRKDSVDHSGIIQNLSLFTFSGSARECLISYLESRQQAIVNEQGLSKFSKHLLGVPLGSI